MDPSTTGNTKTRDMREVRRRIKDMPRRRGPTTPHKAQEGAALQWPPVDPVLVALCSARKPWNPWEMGRTLLEALPNPARGGDIQTVRLRGAGHRVDMGEALRPTWTLRVCY